MGITRDVMRLRGEGKNLRDIRAVIEADWSGAGPGTKTPMPPEGL